MLLRLKSAHLYATHQSMGTVFTPFCMGHLPASCDLLYHMTSKLTHCASELASELLLVKQVMHIQKATVG